MSAPFNEIPEARSPPVRAPANQTLQTQAFRSPAPERPPPGVRINATNIPLSVASVLNTKTNGTVANGGLKPLTDGTIVSVQPLGAQIPHGRLYAQVEVWDTDTLQNLVAVVWAGYITSLNRASYPNLPVLTGYVARLVLTHASGGVSVTEAVNIGLIPGPPPSGPGFIFWEGPGEGRGEPRLLVLANPAAGADYASQVLPAQVKWTVVGFIGLLVTAAAGPNRHLLIYMSANGGAAGFSPAVAPQAGGLTVNYYGVRGQAATDEVSAIAGQINAVGLSDVPVYGTGYYPSGTDSVVFTTLNLQGADDWGGGNLTIEEWAVP